MSHPYQPPGSEGLESDSLLDQMVAVAKMPSGVLSSCLLLHFAFSLYCWLLGLRICISYGISLIETLTFLADGWPALLLFALSVGALRKSVRRKRFAMSASIGVLLLSIAAFCYDVSNENSQLQVNIATVEYWENGGWEHMYFTWYWFNDAWLR